MVPAELQNKYADQDQWYANSHQAKIGSHKGLRNASGLQISNKVGS